MKVNFVTSGFPNGFTEMFLAELRRYLPAQGFFVMVASDFSAHEKSQQYLQQYIRDFSVHGISFQEAALVDFTISPKEAVSLIQRADVIWLSGGPTLTQIRHIKEYRLIEPLLRAGWRYHWDERRVDQHGTAGGCSQGFG